MNRRTFLRRAGGAAAVLGVLPLLGVPGSAPAERSRAEHVYHNGEGFAIEWLYVPGETHYAKEVVFHDLDQLEPYYWYDIRLDLAADSSHMVLSVSTSNFAVLRQLCVTRGDRWIRR